MKRPLILAAAALGLAALMWAEPALAAAGKQPMPAWRQIWDQVWKIVNFAILALFIYKLGKQPLKDFLTGQRSRLAAELEEMEKAKARASAELKAMEKKIGGLSAELAAYEDALSAVAARERETMLAQAERDAELILERAQTQAQGALQQARRNLAGEIVDLAGQIAEEQIRAALGGRDRARLVAEFTREVTQSGG